MENLHAPSVYRKPLRFSKKSPNLFTGKVKFAFEISIEARMPFFSFSFCSTFNFLLYAGSNGFTVIVSSQEGANRTSVNYASVTFQ